MTRADGMDRVHDVSRNVSALRRTKKQLGQRTVGDKLEEAKPELCGFYWQVGTIFGFETHPENAISKALVWEACRRAQRGFALRVV